MSSPEWPPLIFDEWEATCDTLHMWAQIAGKTRMVLAPPQNHWWHVALYVTPSGLTTSPIPYRAKTFEVQFDLISHHALIVTSEGEKRAIPLYPRSVADFYAEYMACLRSVGIDVQFHLTPDEFDDKTPHDEDRHHASYDKDAIERFRRALVSVDRTLKQFRARFQGKCSPVQFFWGSFDLAVTRFSGEQDISCGWWPGDRRYRNAAFYGYGLPKPEGIESERWWNAQLGEFVLNYEVVRAAEDPEKAALEFCQQTYEAYAQRLRWDRKSLDFAGELEKVPV